MGRLLDGVVCRMRGCCVGSEHVGSATRWFILDLFTILEVAQINFLSFHRLYLFLVF